MKKDEYTSLSLSLYQRPGCKRALSELNALNNSLKLGKPIIYVEHYSDVKLEQPELNKLLQEETKKMYDLLKV